MTTTENKNTSQTQHETAHAPMSLHKQIRRTSWLEKRSQIEPTAGRVSQRKISLNNDPHEAVSLESEHVLANNRRRKVHNEDAEFLVQLLREANEIPCDDDSNDTSGSDDPEQHAESAQIDTSGDVETNLGSQQEPVTTTVTINDERTKTVEIVKQLPSNSVSESHNNHEAENCHQATKLAAVKVKQFTSRIAQWQQQHSKTPDDADELREVTSITRLKPPKTKGAAPFPAMPVRQSFSQLRQEALDSQSVMPAVQPNCCFTSGVVTVTPRNNSSSTTQNSGEGIAQAMVASCTTQNPAKRKQQLPHTEPFREMCETVNSKVQQNHSASHAVPVNSRDFEQTKDSKQLQRDFDSSDPQCSDMESEPRRQQNLPSHTRVAQTTTWDPSVVIQPPRRPLAGDAYLHKPASIQHVYSNRDHAAKPAAVNRAVNAPAVVRKNDPKGRAKLQPEQRVQHQPRVTRFDEDDASDDNNNHAASAATSINQKNDLLVKSQRGVQHRRRKIQARRKSPYCSDTKLQSPIPSVPIRDQPPLSANIENEPVVKQAASLPTEVATVNSGTESHDVHSHIVQIRAAAEAPEHNKLGDEIKLGGLGNPHYVDTDQKLNQRRRMIGYANRINKGNLRNIGLKSVQNTVSQPVIMPSTAVEQQKTIAKKPVVRHPTTTQSLQTTNVSTMVEQQLAVNTLTGAGKDQKVLVDLLKTAVRQVWREERQNVPRREKNASGLTRKATALASESVLPGEESGKAARKVATQWKVGTKPLPAKNPSNFNEKSTSKTLTKTAQRTTASQSGADKLTASSVSDDDRVDLSAASSNSSNYIEHIRNVRGLLEKQQQKMDELRAQYQHVNARPGNM